MSRASRLFLDVTSACQSALNTGVKRMQRSLHAWLAQIGEHTPVYWQSYRRGYRTLTAPDIALLEGTGEQALRGCSLYDAPFLAGLLVDALNLSRDMPLQLDWPRDLISGDVILVPDLLWDNRSTYFSQLRDCPAKRVGIFHDAIGLRRPEQSRIDAWLCGRGVRALAHFELVLCISHEAESDLHYFWKKWGLPPAPTQVVPWPVPFAGERPEIRPHFEARTVLYVARLEAHKNHLALLEACERLWSQGESFRLRLIGCHGYPLYTRKVLRRVEALRRQGREIEWQAHVSEAELHRAYAECSCTIFPSLLEGFGLPILESLWHGRPVLCATTGAIGEVAKPGGCAAINPQDPQDMARELKLLLTDAEAYQRLFAELKNWPLRRWTDYGREIAPVLIPVCQNRTTPFD